MTPPAGGNNQNAPQPAIDTEKIYRDMAESQNPREAARKALEQQQKAEEQRIRGQHEKDRAARAASTSSARAEMVPDLPAPPTPTPPAAPQAAPAASPQSAPAATPPATPPVAPQAAPAAAPAAAPQAPETAPSTPPATPPTTPPAPTEGGATPPSAPPEGGATPPPAAPGEQGWTGKFGDFFTKLWESFKTMFAGLSAKLSEMFSSKPAETPATPPPAGQTPAPAPGTTPPAGPPPPTESAPPPPTSSEKPAEADSTWGLKGSELLQHPDFKARSQSIADKLGLPLDALYTIFRIESGGDPKAINKHTGCSGLIQWHPRYTSQYGTTIEQIRSMTGLQQLELVDKHFTRFRGNIRTFADMYRTVFFPASLGKPKSYVLGENNRNPNFSRRVAEQNAGIAKYSRRSDGLIDNDCFDRFCQARYSGGSMPIA